MIKNSFSTFDVIKVFYWTRERLQSWLNLGFVFPSRQKAAGRGTKSIFSRWDVYGLAFFHGLILSGTSREVAAFYYEQWVDCSNKLPLKERSKYRFFVIVRKKKKQIRASLLQMLTEKKGSSDWLKREYDYDGILVVSLEAEKFLKGNWDKVEIFNVEGLVEMVDQYIAKSRD